jgi:hypothetical protein
VSENVVVPIPRFGSGPEGVARLTAFLQSLSAAGFLESVAVVACLKNGDVATIFVEREQGDRFRLCWGASTLGKRILEEPE